MIILNIKFYFKRIFPKFHNQKPYRCQVHDSNRELNHCNRCSHLPVFNRWKSIPYGRHQTRRHANVRTDAQNKKHEEKHGSKHLRGKLKLWNCIRIRDESQSRSALDHLSYVTGSGNECEIAEDAENYHSGRHWRKRIQSCHNQCVTIKKI